MRTYGEVFGEALDPLAFAWLFAVELLGVELLVEAQRFDLAMQTREVCLGGGGEVKPRGSCGFVLHLLSLSVR